MRGAEFCRTKFGSQVHMNANFILRVAVCDGVCVTVCDGVCVCSVTGCICGQFYCSHVHYFRFKVIFPECICRTF